MTVRQGTQPRGDSEGEGDSETRDTARLRQNKGDSETRDPARVTVRQGTQRG